MALERWEPIKDLPENWGQLASQALAVILAGWNQQAGTLRETPAYEGFLARLTRQIAIETGVLERLYTIDRGITRLLVERGIAESLIPHGATDKPASEVIALVRDHQQAIEGLFKFVKGERTLTVSYVRELHQALTAHQEWVDALDPFGNPMRVKLLRGEWKRGPNNPTRPDGSLYFYAPPEQVQPQMETLIAWHQAHLEQGVPPEVEAAWLHHRFTEIHPFQDGNGRVARMLASLVFIRAGGFPLIITRDQRGEYIDALEAADSGDLGLLVTLFGDVQAASIQAVLELIK
jgi:Fic family protein